MELHQVSINIITMSLAPVFVGEVGEGLAEDGGTAEVEGAGVEGGGYQDFQEEGQYQTECMCQGREGCECQGGEQVGDGHGGGG